MDLRQALARQFTYDTWANQELYAFLVGCDLVPPKAWSLFDHILGTSATWIARLAGSEPPLELWPSLDEEQRTGRLTDQARAWQALIAEADDSDWDRTLNYANSKGTPFSMRRVDVLHHVSAHAHYHRGQIASALRRVGVAPPWTDPVLWTRLTGDA